VIAAVEADAEEGRCHDERRSKHRPSRSGGGGALIALPSGRLGAKG
jgi:hypothetical protein